MTRMVAACSRMTYVREARGSFERWLWKKMIPCIDGCHWLLPDRVMQLLHLPTLWSFRFLMLFILLVVLLPLLASPYFVRRSSAFVVRTCTHHSHSKMCRWCRWQTFCITPVKFMMLSIWRRWLLRYQFMDASIDECMCECMYVYSTARIQRRVVGKRFVSIWSSLWCN